MMPSLVVFRADGGPTIGGGHMMRCLALAAAFAGSGSRVAFAVTQEAFKSIAALNASPYEKLIVNGNAAEEAEQIGSKWGAERPLLVADHYGRDIVFERACRVWAKGILVIDDLADREHDADILIDSGAPTAAPYQNLVPQDCRVLTGPSYAIVHPAFLLAREAAMPRRDGRKVSRILVTLGQMDPDNATGLALDAIEASGFSGAVDVALGQSAAHLATIRRRAKGKVNLYVNATNMAALMATSDLSIGAGGVTALERCCVGLPSLLIEIAANQRIQIGKLEQAGAAVFAGAYPGLTKEQLSEALLRILRNEDQRKSMSRIAAELVDGRGIERILVAANAIENGKS